MEETDATSALPSTVEESLLSCPQFRIVLIGISGVGKSSLVQKIFKIDLKAIDIAHDRAGQADIKKEYTSKENKRFILHDSQGFEAGSEGNWKIVDEFLHERSKMKLADRVHAIWLCILTPREGTRLEQTGDEKLLSLANKLNIPVIAVFTKYDQLVSEQHIKALKMKVNLSDRAAEENAARYFNDRVRGFQQRTGAAIVKVSTSDDYDRRFETLLELTKVTRQCLGDNDEAGTVPFIIAQRVNTSQKVELSVRQGFKKYWRDLGSSSFFHGHKLNQCVWRIHDDVLKVWNFNDPGKVLSSQKFCAEMVLLANPMIDTQGVDIEQDDIFSKCLDVAAAALTIASPFAVFLIAAGISLLALKFLYGTYKKIPPSAQYLGAYITALTCVLHQLFQEIAALEESSVLTEDRALKVVARYKDTQAFRHQSAIRDMSILHGFEKKIVTLILAETNTQEVDNLSTLMDPQGDGARGTSGQHQEGQEEPMSSPGKKRRTWKRLFGK